MPPPRPIRCGGAGEPACPPVDAVTVLKVIRWYKALSAEHKALYDEAAHGREQ